MYTTENDYRTLRRLELLDNMLGNERSQLAYFGSLAEDFVGQYLSPHYDMDWEYSRTGDERNKLIVRWVVIAATFFVAQKTMPNSIPENLSVEYGEIREELAAIRRGEGQIRLRRKTDETGAVQDVKTGTLTNASQQQY